MTDASPAILSIAMLAAFALAWGGVRLVRTRRDRKRGWLMVVMAIVLLANVLIWAVPVQAGSGGDQKGDGTFRLTRTGSFPSGSKVTSV